MTQGKSKKISKLNPKDEFIKVKLKKFFQHLG